MELKFVKTSPAQNVTVLVETPVPRAQQPAVAEQLLQYDGVGGEQVGYLEPATFPGANMRLQMMGGEFCGNATMSVGAYLAWKSGLADGEKAEYLFEVSGATSLVPCSVRNRNGHLIGSVQMPLPESVGSVTFPLSGSAITLPRVDLPGITHLIAPADFPRAEAENVIRNWQKALNVPALGILVHDPAAREFTPLVYVAATDTAVWEHGCGSGTAAIGCINTIGQSAPASLTLRQPGGEISVETQYQDGTITAITISTEVRIVMSGTAYL